jgi:arginine exporter protein ArgO
MNSIYLIIYSALLTISIIAGIGPQTMNIISHSISKNHAFSVTITAVIADVILILVGCIGVIAIESKALLNIIYLIIALQKF